MANADGWKFLKNIKDACIYTKESERKITMVKGVVDFPFTPDEVVSQVLIVEEWKYYDDQIDDGNIVSSHCHDTFIGYGRLKRIAILSPWDLIFVTQFIKDNDTGIVYTPTFSIDHPDFPEKKEPVWASILLGGWILIPT